MEASAIKVAMLVLTEMRFDARVHREADALGRAGYDVVVYGLYDGVGPLKENRQTYKLRRIQVLSRHWLPSRPLYHLLKYLEFVLRACKNLILERADIYHAHDLNALVPLFIVSVLTNRPLVYDAHELWCQIPGRPLLSLWSRLEKILIQRCVLLIAPNQERLNFLVKSYNFGGETIVVQNTPEFQIVESNSYLLDFVKQQNSRIEQILVLHGRLDALKMPDLAIKALRYCRKNVGLVLIGPIEALYKDELIGLAKEEGVLERTFFHSPVPHERLLEIIAGADVGLVFYKPEGLNNLYCAPNKFYEYLIAGVPMVGNRLPSLCSLIEEKGVGIVCETDPQAVGQTIEALFLQPQLMQEMREKAKSLAREHFNWSVEQERLLMAYKRIVEEGK